MVRILIASGNANTGSETVRQLVKLGHKDIVVGTRDVAANEAKLKALGASAVVYIDLDKPETVQAAMKGVDRALLVHGSPSTGLPGLSTWAQVWVDAAKANGVKFICRVSGAGANPNYPGFPGAQGKADEIISKSGLDWATFNPSFFLDNWFSKVPEIKGYGQVTFAARDGLVGYVAVHDIGAVAAHVLANPDKFKNKAYVITGPKPVTDLEVSQAIGEAIGKPIRFNHVSVEDFGKLMASYGIPAGAVEMMKGLEEARIKGFANFNSDEVEKVTGKRAMTPLEWAKTVAPAFQ